MKFKIYFKLFLIIMLALISNYVRNYLDLDPYVVGFAVGLSVAGLIVLVALEAVEDEEIK